jgi:hypothetical protein
VHKLSYGENKVEGATDWEGTVGATAAQSRVVSVNRIQPPGTYEGEDSAFKIAR